VRVLCEDVQVLQAQRNSRPATRKPSTVCDPFGSAKPTRGMQQAAAHGAHGATPQGKRKRPRDLVEIVEQREPPRVQPIAVVLAHSDETVQSRTLNPKTLKP